LAEIQLFCLEANFDMISDDVTGGARAEMKRDVYQWRTRTYSARGQAKVV